MALDFIPISEDYYCQLSISDAKVAEISEAFYSISNY